MANGPNYKHGSLLPKTIHAHPLKGSKDRGGGEDFRKWYKCGWCGFICKIGRDELGGRNSRSGESHRDYTIPSNIFDSSPIISVGGPIDSSLVLLELGSDGEPKEILHGFETNISSGCPFCGSKNWKGEHK